MIEIWKPVVGHEGRYEVSNLGRVRGLARTTTFIRKWKSGIVRETEMVIAPKLLVPGVGSHGYPTVNLSPPRRNFCVHVLVLEAFRGARPNSMEGRHLDGNRLNPELKNLAWGTRVENTADARQHGTLLIGTRHPSAKLTETTASEILLLKGKKTLDELSRIYRVSPSTIYAVICRRSWKHVS